MPYNNTESPAAQWSRRLSNNSKVLLITQSKRAPDVNLLITTIVFQLCPFRRHKRGLWHYRDRIDQQQQHAINHARSRTDLATSPQDLGYRRYTCALIFHGTVFRPIVMPRLSISPLSITRPNNFFHCRRRPMTAQLINHGGFAGGRYNITATR